MKKDSNKREADRTFAFRMAAVVLVLYWLIQIIRGYIAGGPDAPSLTLLIIASAVLGGGACIVTVLSWRTWRYRRNKDKEE